MICNSPASHIVRPGESLFKIARIYGVTVPEILAANPHISIYNLKIGSELIICSDGIKEKPSTEPNFSKYLNLSNQMRLVWEQHIYWTRMLLLSIAERLQDQGDVTSRLLQNPSDIANIFKPYYGNAIAREISELLTEHLKIGAEIITALRDGKNEEANILNIKWHENADQMAAAFSRINPNYDREDLKKMLYDHLALTTNEVAMRLAKNYKADIEAFDKVEKEAISMADYFSTGIAKQFPEKFM